MTSALVIEDLTVTYATQHGPVHAVDGADLKVAPGECVALVGESGSGKSSIAAATLGVLPGYASVSGRVAVAGHDLTGASEAERCTLRGRVVGYVPQDTGAAFNPVLPVVDQVGEPFRLHRGLSRQSARAEAARRLEAIGVDAAVAERRLLPDELSGGMRQRALLVAALCLDPALVVADEPTAALDAEATLGVVDVLTGMRTSAGSAVLFVTHDLGVARAVADRVVVLYGGQVMEAGPAAAVLASSRHPYTQGLVAATPSLGPRARRPAPIPGEPGTPGEAHKGCPFSARCPVAIERCRTVRPELVVAAPAHQVACHLTEPADG